MNGQDYNYDNYNPIGGRMPPPPPMPESMLKENRNRNGFGIAAMVFGCLALAFFMMFINIPFAIAAIISGAIQLLRFKPKAFAWIGIVSALCSIVLMVVGWSVIFSAVLKMDDEQIDTFREQFEKQYQIELEENDL